MAFIRNDPDENVFLHEFTSPIYDDKDAPIELMGWYFWDNSGEYNGPFSTKQEAREICAMYCDTF